MFEAKLSYIFIDFRSLDFQNFQAIENDHSGNPKLTFRSSGQNWIQFQINPIFTVSERNA